MKYIITISISIAMMVAGHSQDVPSSSSFGVQSMTRNRATKLIIAHISDLEERVVALENNAGQAVDTEWTIFIVSLNAMSKTAFSRKYSEAELVKIALTREKLPDWLKDSAGSVGDKRKWYWANKQTIQDY